MDRMDIMNLDGKTMIIYRENLNKYLERYFCENERDLEVSMWQNYGIYVQVVD